MKVLIIANGEIRDIQKVKAMLPQVDYTICADGGVRHARGLGVVPDLIVGDFDSLPDEALREYSMAGIPIKRYPADKDKTDMQIAVDTAVDMGASQVFLLGAFGSRWDHSYANMLMLYRLATRGIKAQILDSHNVVMVSSGKVEIEGEIGQTLSLLPLSGDVRILRTDGLKYPIVDGILPLDFPYGVSNVLVKPRAEVHVCSGWVMVVVARD
ncbi:thiamine diphosphokinase [Caldicoprobacter algeriensis]|uniref:thiamine diphosphokinase n=1 Tax=Caldicoprobacter algeriensis TaxID=699281 RepID=UPI00207A9211|nr:thiamine diphosphokinase [Caldicoprobacter algeriensis]MCM8899772.1 thiamine diphosphokinase [Caldicoprobacter algeriensis]